MSAHEACRLHVWLFLIDKKQEMNLPRDGVQPTERGVTCHPRRSARFMSVCVLHKMHEHEFTER